MADQHQLLWWLLDVTLYLAVPIVLTGTWLRYGDGRRLERLASWVRDHSEPDETLDPFVQDLTWALRAARLQTDLDRLRLLVATDTAMSATRQIANRMAYQMVLREVAEAAGRTSTAAVAVVTHSSFTRSSSASSRDGWQSPQVELLDVRWNR